MVVFTTPERDRFLRTDPELAAAVERLKPRWLAGLHHNWHDHAFTHDPLFDFSMAGEGDLVTVDRTEVPLVTLDACNFVPAEFEPGGTKFWDLLYVARPVAFKGMPQFLDCVRALYDAGHDLRVLCVCPMPPHDPAEESTVLFDLQARYLERFSQSERRRFTLWTLDYDYPFPLDLPTLAHLYRSSRCFVHFAPDERRCRVAGYAWATGLPVVAKSPVGSLLPPDLRRRPFFYEVPDDAAFADRILSALDALARGTDSASDEVRQHFVTSETTAELRRQLCTLAPAGLEGDDGWALEGLDIRLGRHHGIPGGPNGVPMTLRELIDVMLAESPALVDAGRQADPELALASSEPVPTTNPRQPTRSRWRALLRGWK
ncbi:MAG TPA: hypothetical protein VF257_16995 [Solirubrobacteraceae bacterium]